MTSPLSPDPVVTDTGAQSLTQRLLVLLRSPGLRDGLIMTAATLTAGGLDYLFNVLTGRFLAPLEFSLFVAVTAMLRVAMELTNVIRNVTAHYVAELTGDEDPNTADQIGAFVQRMWRWALRWGAIAMIVLALLSPLLAWWFRADTIWPVLAAALALLLLFIRPVTDGSLQGLQAFTGLGTVVVIQAVMRLIIAGFLLIVLQWQAAGAILSLPLASGLALLVAVWLLAPQFRVDKTVVSKVKVSTGYSLQTVAGLLFYALLVNIDAMVVARLFGPEVAGNYAPIVTLGKINLFVPLAMGLVLFPKATQRYAEGRDPRPVLALALLATLVAGVTFTVLLGLFNEIIIGLLFTDAYSSLGIVLPLVGLATTLYAGIYIWLNYALAIKRRTFVFALGGVLLFQIVGMVLAAGNIILFAGVMVTAGVLGNVAGFLTTTLRFEPADR